VLVYIICPVRMLTEDVKAQMDAYVAGLESFGHQVHYPPRDVDQTDPVGTHIVRAHRKAMRKATAVHVYWDASSFGSHVDLGMAIALGKPIQLINDPPRTPHKSYTNVLRIMAGKDEA
jgi:hypothetical protein